MRFKLRCRHEKTGAESVFVYDNQDGRLYFENGALVPVDMIKGAKPMKRPSAAVFSPAAPAGKSRTPRVLKIQLGLSCNYACTYCSQRFVPRADETSRKHIPKFMERLDRFMQAAPQRIEFWGGEPLVYIKTIKPLAEELKRRYPDAELVMITNGSLLTLELNEWLDDMGFQIGVSHDGPGQWVRGPDPFDDPKSKEAILDLYRRLGPQGRMSFNTMINRHNLDRERVQAFFVEVTGDPNVPIGEGSLIDAYDDDGLAMSLQGEEDHVKLRRDTLRQLRQGTISNFSIVVGRLHEMVRTLTFGRSTGTLGTKCGMERPDNIAVDLMGNVLTCQNVSAVSDAPNGRAHKIGHIDEPEKIKLDTSYHWSTRDHCAGCPVLQFCAGSCMFLTGERFWSSCNNSFSDRIPFLAYAIELATGFTPYYIEAEHLPESRRDIFGESASVNVMQVKKPGVVPRKISPNSL